MEALDVVLLARWQFAFTMTFHIVFPAFSIGLASYLAVLEALWLWTKRDYYLSLFDYWKKIFAVAFGMGVVSGIVMSYQFGTNWSVFSDRAGPVIGPLMGYEVLTAFFLEAGFLGIMLFGRPWQVRDGGSPGLRGARHPQAQLAASKTSSVAVASQAASASLVRPQAWFSLLERTAKSAFTTAMRFSMRALARSLASFA
jgi:hypothetical protein